MLGRRPPRRPSESVDFTPKVNHAERVQIVNGCHDGIGFRLLHRFDALDEIVNVDTA